MVCRRLEEAIRRGQDVEWMLYDPAEMQTWLFTLPPPGLIILDRVPQTVKIGRLSK